MELTAIFLIFCPLKQIPEEKVQSLPLFSNIALITHSLFFSTTLLDAYLRERLVSQAVNSMNICKNRSEAKLRNTF